MDCLYLIFYACLRLLFLDVETNPDLRHPVPDLCRIFCSNMQCLAGNLSDLTVASSQHDILLYSETLVSDMGHVSELLIPGFCRPVLLCRGNMPGPRDGCIRTWWLRSISANVTAIHKKGRRQEPGKCRHISLTSEVCKTMVRLVKGRLITYLEMNNLTWLVTQHGFRNKRSCLTRLLDFYAQVIDMYDTDNNKVVGRSCLSGLLKSIRQGTTWKTNAKRQCTWHLRWCSQMDPKLVSWSSPMGMHQPIL